VEAGVKAAIITISTAGARGEREDLSGQALADMAAAAGFEVVARELVSDDRAQIEEALRRHTAPAGAADLLFTTGGTGLTPDDITPEATKAVIERDVPGLAEAMRAESLKYTPMGMLSRGVCGVAGRTLIVNFPGSPKSIQQLFGLIEPVLPHAVALLGREPGQGSHPHGHH
jgi:molybdenum cofactor synthesis domain-containing protein